MSLPVELDEFTALNIDSSSNSSSGSGDNNVTSQANGRRARSVTFDGGAVVSSGEGRPRLRSPPAPNGRTINGNSDNGNGDHEEDVPAVNFRINKSWVNGDHEEDVPAVHFRINRSWVKDVVSSSHSPDEEALEVKKIDDADNESSSQDCVVVEPGARKRLTFSRADPGAEKTSPPPLPESPEKRRKSFPQHLRKRRGRRGSLAHVMLATTPSAAKGRSGLRKRTCCSPRPYRSPERVTTDEEPAKTPRRKMAASPRCKRVRMMRRRPLEENEEDRDDCEDDVENAAAMFE